MKALFILAVLLSAIYAGGPLLAERKMKDWLNSACSQCMEWKSLSLGWTSFHFEGFRFQTGDPRDSQWKAEISSLSGSFSPLSLLSKEVRISGLKVQNAAVTLTEGRADSPAGKSHSGWTFQIESTEITDSRFTYQKELPRGKALIKIRNVRIHAGSWGTSKPDVSTEAEAHGILEDSGEFDLTVDAKFFDPETRGDIKLEIRHMNLATMDPYFLPAAGITLKGRLLTGRAQSRIRGITQNAWVLAEYRDLDVNVHSRRGRTGLEAFLADLAAEISLEDSNLERDLPSQVRGVTVKRREESIVTFIFRAWKEAAMQVAKNG